MKRSLRRLLMISGLALALTTAMGNGFGQLAGAATITAQYLATIGDGLAANDPAWTSGVTQYTIALDSLIGPTGVPQLLPSSTWRYLKVKAIHNGTDVFFRFEWADTTANVSVGDLALFADAVAMEIPFVNPSTIAMGNQREPVNILFWRADMIATPTSGRGRPQNIVAGGAGTVQKSSDSDLLPIAQSQGYAAKAWTVILKRPLSAVAGGNLVPLARAKSYRICFAQWNGAGEERNGLKMVAGTWHTLFVQ